MKNSSHLDNKVAEILDSTTSVQLELSNLCNFSFIHKKCYAHQSEQERGKIILPSKLITNVIETLAKYGWDNPEHEVKFHEYNEPLIDPRLVKIVENTRKSLSSTGIMIWSNGFYLDDIMAEELVESGVNRIRLTAYSQPEYDRFVEIKKKLQDRLDKKEVVSPNELPVYFRITARKELDDRMTVREKDEAPRYDPCYALKGISIRSDGQITLCCMDVFEDITFGNIHEGFEQALSQNYTSRIKVKAELERGTRTLDLCRRCNYTRPTSTNVLDNWDAAKIYDGKR